MKKVGVIFATFAVACSAFAGYTRLDFFQCNFTGTGQSTATASWVNTGIVPACTDRIEMKIRLTKWDSTQNLFCSRQSNNGNSMTAFILYDGSLGGGNKLHPRFDRTSNKLTHCQKVFANGDADDHIIVYDGNAAKGYVDGANETSLTAGTYTPGSQMTLFASHGGTVPGNGGSVGNQAKYRFYYCRIYNKDGKLVHNFVPVRDDSVASGAKMYGVYDTVGKRFCQNLGTVGFVATGSNELGKIAESPVKARTATIGASTLVEGQVKTVLNIANAGFAQRAYLAWGDTDGGNTTNGWDHVDALADISATETSRIVDIPNGAKFVRFFLQPAVAAGCTAVDYLKSSGTVQTYMNTGFKPNSLSRADYKFEIESTTSAKNTIPFGSRNDNTYQFFAVSDKTGPGWNRRHGALSANSGNANAPAVVGLHNFSHNCGVMNFDGNSYTFGRSDFDATYDAYIFAGNNNGTVQYPCPCRMYSLTIWDDGAMVRDYIPVRDAAGNPAFYDAVHSTLIYNLGSTAPTMGEEVWTQTETIPTDLTAARKSSWTGAGSDPDDLADPANWASTNIVGNAVAAVPNVLTDVTIVNGESFNCPPGSSVLHRTLTIADCTLTQDLDWRGLGLDLVVNSHIDVNGHTLKVATLKGSGRIGDNTGWTELDHIRGTGAQHHIVLNYTPLCTDRIETEVYQPSFSGNQAIWCARGENTLADTMTCFYIGSTLRIDRNDDTQNTSSINPTAGKWQKIVADYKTLEFLVDGELGATMRDGNFTPASKLCLYASHQGAETAGLNNWGKFYMRYFKVYDQDGTLKVNLVPRMRNSDDASGLYDTISGTFYVANNQHRMGDVVSTEATGTLVADISDGEALNSTYFSPLGYDYMCACNTLTLGGGLKLVKEGSQLLVLGRQYQFWAGGTVINAGVAKPYNYVDANTYSEQFRIWGGFGTTITVNAGTVFDIAGNYDYGYHNFILNGGRLASSTHDMAVDGYGSIDRISITADSEIDSTANMTFNGPVDLGGNTLTVSTVSGKSIYFGSNASSLVMTNGTLVLGGSGGWFRIHKPADMRTVNIRHIGTALEVQQPTEVHDYYADYFQAINVGSGTMKVHGTFTPKSTYFFGVTMCDGSTIDLTSAVTNRNGEAWSTTSEMNGGKKTVDFESGATVTIDIHDRTPAQGELIVAWAARPNDVTFQWDAATAERGVLCAVSADGIHYGADPNSTEVEKAVWTGAAGDGDLRNRANWTCYNLAEVVVPNSLPTSASTIELTGETAFDFTYAQWLPFIDNPIDSENKAATVCSFRNYGTTRTAPTDDSFVNMPAADYLFIGECPLANMREDAWCNSYVAQSQARFDGWFKVEAEQAGNWTLRQHFDDYFAFIVDGDKLFSAYTYAETSTTCTMTEGWHRFTIVVGDYSGGKGPKLSVGGQLTVLGVSINGGAEVCFEDAFTFGSGPSTMWKKIHVANGCKLSADCDWSAADLSQKLNYIDLSGVLDLNGHSLKATLIGGCNGTITNSSDTVGTLRYYVPAGVSGNQSALTITGNTRFVKDGPGTANVTKTGNSYTAGTEVVAGTLKANTNPGGCPFGPENSQIIVRAGGTFDQVGKGAYGFYKFILDGGSIKSSSDTGNGTQQIYDMRLTADSYVAGTSNFGMIGGGYAPTFIDLGGHTLYVSVATGKHFWVYNTTISNGVLKTTSGGHIDFDKTAVYAYDVDFDNNVAIIHNVDAHFRDFTDRYCSNYGGGSGHICVHGTFTPVGTHFHNAKLMDGSTLDLSDKNGAWSTTSLNTAGGQKYCTFAEGATVTVDCHGRTLAAGDQLVAWATQPTGASFVLDAASAAAIGDATLAAKADGLYIDRLAYVGGEMDSTNSWNDAAGNPPDAVNGYPLHLVAHAGDPTAVEYARGVLTSLAASPVYVEGAYSFTGIGGIYLAKLDVAAAGRMIIDPVACTLRLKGAPVFAAGAKLALSANYADNTNGRFLLMTWDNGTLDPASLAGLFDASCAAGANPQLTVETVGNGGRLWLDLAAGTVKPKLNVLAIGDTIARGSPDIGNWRIPFMKRMAAAGYDVKATGYWTVYSDDICGAKMPSAWLAHSADAQMQINSSVNAGYLQAIDNVLVQANDVDFVINQAGVNEIAHPTALGVYPAWSNLIERIVAAKPHAKVIAATVVDRTCISDQGPRVLELNAQIREAVADGIFGAGKVVLADIHAALGVNADGTGENWHDLYTPSRYGQYLSAMAFADAALAAIASDPGWQTGYEETKPTTSGATVNVPAAELAGFTLARVMDVAATQGTTMNPDGKVPYLNYDDCEAEVADIGRVGYYIELKRKNTALNDYRGEVRWLWASCDAFGDRDIDTVGVPLKKVSACQVSHLRVKTNMPGIAETPDGETELGSVEFWKNSYDKAQRANTSAAPQVYGYDWNDSTGSGNHGSMQLFRYTPGEIQPAQLLFAFNRWSSGPKHEIGLGEFACQTAGSLDWTIVASTEELYQSMCAGAYEVARIEIWTTPASVTENVVTSATWTGNGGDNDVTNPANWNCTNRLGQAVLNGVPDNATSVTIAGNAVNLDGASLQALQVFLGDMTLAADLDLSGINLVTFAGRVDVNGHTLKLKQLIGAGEVTDSNAFDLTTTDAAKASSSTVFFGGTAANVFNNNYARDSQNNDKRVIVTNANLPIVVDYDFGAGTVVDCYRVWCGPIGDAHLARCPGQWEIYGSDDGANWTLLGKEGTVGWNDEAHGLYFTFENETAYRRYRFQINEPVSRADDYTELVQLEYGRQSRFGTLVLTTPLNTTVDNSAITLSGNLKVVKQGGGTYVATKTNQSAVGPMVVEEGLVKPGQLGTSLPFGGKGNQLVIEPNGTLDMNGKYDFGRFTFVLNGGTLKNSVSISEPWKKEMIRRVRVGADSTLNFMTYGFIATNYHGTEVVLNGYTLDGKCAGGCYWANTHFTEGVVKSEIASGGYVESYNGGSDKGAIWGPDTVFEFSGVGRFSLNSNVGAVSQLGDYVCRRTAADTQDYNGKIDVYHRFAPVTQYFRGCRLLDGATLDLTERTETFSVKSLNTGASIPKFVTFADNATITVDLHGRRCADGDKVVDWSGDGEAPANLAGLTFKLDAATKRSGLGVKKKSDGLYLYRNNTVIFLR